MQYSVDVEHTHLQQGLIQCFRGSTLSYGLVFSRKSPPFALFVYPTWGYDTGVRLFRQRVNHTTAVHQSSLVDEEVSTYLNASLLAYVLRLS